MSDFSCEKIMTLYILKFITKKIKRLIPLQFPQLLTF